MQRHRYLENFLRALGKPLAAFVSRVGELSEFIAKALYNCVTPPFYPKLLLRQIVDIGFYSLPVVALTTIFAGMVIALQTHAGFSSYGAESAIASATSSAFSAAISLLFISWTLTLPTISTPPSMSCSRSTFTPA